MRFGAPVRRKSKGLKLYGAPLPHGSRSVFVPPSPRRPSFAQDAPVQLHPPSAAAEKSAKPAKAPAAPLSAAEAVARANAWLDAARVMTADFVQIGPDGKRSEGQLTVERPGRMLFKYVAPARFEIVADGRSVAVIDHKLNTQDEYYIAQTPLKFLLADHIDLARDTRVLSVAQEGDAATIEIEDKAALGGSAHISLVFDRSTFALRQWTVIDAQGFQTVVTLFDIDLDHQAGPGAVPHRRVARQPARQSQKVMAAALWESAGAPLAPAAPPGNVALTRSWGRA